MSGRRDRTEGPGTGWASVIFDRLVALGATLILSGIVGIVAAAKIAALGFDGDAESEVPSLGTILFVWGLALLFPLIGDAWGTGTRNKGVNWTGFWQEVFRRSTLLVRCSCWGLRKRR